MSAPPLPEPVAALTDELTGLGAAVAVVLGGSRASGTHRPDSDWDLGVYYRGAFDPEELRRLGHRGYVSELGEWGPIMNGGAWLTVDRTAVDVIFRDLDAIERWLADAALSEAHARLAERSEWVLNEKRLVARAGLGDVQPLMGAPGSTSAELTATVAAVAERLAVEPLHPR